MKKTLLPILILALIFHVPASAQTTAPSSAASTPGSSPDASKAALDLSAADIAALINQCGEQTTRDTSKMYRYTYTQTKVLPEYDKRGKLKKESVTIFEAYPVPMRRSAVTIKVSEDGVRLSPEQITREREQASKELIEAEERLTKARERQAKLLANQPPAVPSPMPDPALSKPQFRSWGITSERGILGFGSMKFRISPTDFLTSHTFDAPRRAELKGRETIVLNFRPRADAPLDDLSGRVRSRLGGRLWIDAIDKNIVRLEAVPLAQSNTSATMPNNDAPVIFEYARLPNGTWVITSLKVIPNGYESVFEKVRFNAIYRFDDYKLFITETEGEKLDAPKQSTH